MLILQLVPVGGGLLMAETRGVAGGTVLLIPVGQAARRALPARALDGHSRLLGEGLLPGSLVIRVDGGIAPPFWADGVIALPVPLRACGARQTA